MIVFGMEHPDARRQSRVLLARAVQRYWGMECLPEIVQGERGKPYFPEHPECHFNISHSGNLVLCVLDCADVGIDIQMHRPWREKLLERVCSGEEREWLRRRGDRPEDCALLWAMKESVCKHSGRGLWFPVSEITVPLPQQGESVLERDGLRFWLGSGPDWQMCLCGTGTWDRTIEYLKETDVEENRHDSTGM